MAVTQATTDEELMEAYAAGEIAAFDELYARYSGKVHAYLAKRVFNKGQQDDLFQVIFLKLHKSRQLYNSQFLFAPWLFTICRTSLVDYLKLRKSLATEPVDATELSESPVGDAVIGISEAIADLPDGQRKALELRYQDGLDFSEIAARLNISAINVRQVVSRAVRKLRGLK